MISMRWLSGRYGHFVVADTEILPDLSGIMPRGKPQHDHLKPFNTARLTHEVFIINTKFTPS